MLKKHTLFTITLLCSAPLYAIQIESKGLSQDAGNYVAATPAAINTSNSADDSTATTPTNLNWQLMQKAERLENDIRSLRGKMEEQDNEIAQLKHDLQNRYTDLDQRLELLQEKVDPDSVAKPEEDNQQDTSPSTNAKSAVNTATTTVKAQSTPSAQISPSKNKDEADKVAYTVALEAYKQGGAKKAIAPMQAFIKNHPNSAYISNAYFWLAEFNLGTDPTNYVDAKKNFEIVANKYPNSSKASSALYRLHSISLNVDKNAALANKYKNQILTNYPKSEEAGFLKK